MEAFETLTSHLAPLPIDNVDTDQIIPARYLKVTDRSGLAEGLFSNWRDQPDFVLDRPEARAARILLAGYNFGCGSSREHAPWALLDHGFRAVISTRFADIFRNNSLKNGLLLVEVDEEVWRELLARVERDPGYTVTIDLEQNCLSMPNEADLPARDVAFEIDAFARECMLRGVDQFGYLLEQLPKVEAWEAERRAPVDTRMREDAERS